MTKSYCPITLYKKQPHDWHETILQISHFKHKKNDAFKRNLSENNSVAESWPEKNYKRRHKSLKCKSETGAIKKKETTSYGQQRKRRLFLPIAENPIAV